MHRTKDQNVCSRIVVYGCGGHARSIITALKRLQCNNILCVDPNGKENETILGIPILREVNYLEDDGMIIAIGDNLQRESIYNNYRDKVQFITVIAESSIVDDNVELGNGIFIGEHTYIGPATKIGNNSIINTNAVIEHDVCVGRNSHIAPSVTICGKSIIGNNCLIGAGTTIIDEVSVCDNVVVGAGGAIVHSIQESGVYIGVPVRKVKELC
ncbi:MAG: NeuD/PglB/VioB family sugar acetyltransferase [Eubacteriales bacterium]